MFAFVSRAKAQKYCLINHSRRYIHSLREHFEGLSHRRRIVISFESNASKQSLYNRRDKQQQRSLFQLRSSQYSFLSKWHRGNEVRKIVDLKVKTGQEKVVISSTQTLDESTKAVNIAILANIFCGISKFGAFLYTGSGSMLSEALHSVADVANQVFLYIGIQRSKKQPTEEHPYGFGGERFIWALISAVGLFTFGSAGSIFHGFHALSNPSELESLHVALFVLGTSFALESISLIAAIQAIRTGARENNMTFLQYIKNGPDPMGTAVLLEDAAAILGLGIASLATTLSYFTGSPFYDATGSIFIGSLLGVTAVFLIRKNVSSLAGKSMPQQKKQTIRALLENHPNVDQVSDVRAVMLGADVATVSAEIVFDGRSIAEEFLKEHSLSNLHMRSSTEEGLREVLLEYGQWSVERIAKEVGGLEEQIKTEIPEIKFVDIETH